MSSKPGLKKLRHFIYHEARLIDEKRWDEWEYLFAEDGKYWVPATHGQPDPLNHVSIVYEGPLLRSVRLKRYRHPSALSLQPEPHSVHLISNVMLDSYDKEGEHCVVNSRQIMLEHRRDQQTVYGGAVTHHLVRNGKGWKIELKKVELVNCDAALSSLQIYL